VTSHTRRERHRERHLAIRVVVGIAGFAALVGGIAMLVLPGPGLAAIAVGLGLLALEFHWAERMLARVQRRLETVTPSRRGPRIAFWIGTGVLTVAGLALSALYLY
jgi:uncharacterized protein (TIGR02611 family)